MASTRGYLWPRYQHPFIEEVDRIRVRYDMEKRHSLVVSGVDVRAIGEKKVEDVFIAHHVEEMDRLEFVLINRRCQRRIVASIVLTALTSPAWTAL